MHLFEAPIKTQQIRKNVFLNKYRNGLININGQKFIGYSIKDAVKIYRQNNPIKTV